MFTVIVPLRLSVGTMMGRQCRTGAPMMRHPTVATWDVQKIAGEARIDARTARLVLLGDPSCSPRSRQLVIDAVARLNLAIIVPTVDDAYPSRFRNT